MNENIFKFSDAGGPTLCRVKQVDVSSTFIKHIFRSGLTLVSSNAIITIKIDDIITIKIDKRIVKNHKKINKQKRLFIKKE